MNKLHFVADVFIPCCHFSVVDIKQGAKYRFFSALIVKYVVYGKFNKTAIGIYYKKLFVI